MHATRVHMRGSAQLSSFDGLRHTAAMTPKIEAKARLSAADWEQAALETLAENGLAAVAVESLARRLGVTKGSFYWHFPTREALIQATIERWEHDDEAQAEHQPLEG